MIFLYVFLFSIGIISLSGNVYYFCKNKSIVFYFSLSIILFLGCFYIFNTIFRLINNGNYILIEIPIIIFLIFIITGIPGLIMLLLRHKYVIILIIFTLICFIIGRYMWSSGESVFYDTQYYLKMEQQIFLHLSIFNNTRYYMQESIYSFIGIIAYYFNYSILLMHLIVSISITNLLNIIIYLWLINIFKMSFKRTLFIFPLLNIMTNSIFIYVGVSNMYLAYLSIFILLHMVKRQRNFDDLLIFLLMTIICLSYTSSSLIIFIPAIILFVIYRQILYWIVSVIILIIFSIIFGWNYLFIIPILCTIPFLVNIQIYSMFLRIMNKKISILYLLIIYSIIFLSIGIFYICMFPSKNSVSSFIIAGQITSWYFLPINLLLSISMIYYVFKNRINVFLFIVIILFAIFCNGRFIHLLNIVYSLGSIQIILMRLNYYSFFNQINLLIIFFAFLTIRKIIFKHKSIVKWINLSLLLSPLGILIIIMPNFNMNVLYQKKQNIPYIKELSRYIQHDTLFLSINSQLLLSLYQTTTKVFPIYMDRNISNISNTYIHNRQDWSKYMMDKNVKTLFSKSEKILLDKKWQWDKSSRDTLISSITIYYLWPTKRYPLPQNNFSKPINNFINHNVTNIITDSIVLKKFPTLFTKTKYKNTLGKVVCQ